MAQWGCDKNEYDIVTFSSLKRINEKYVGLTIIAYLFTTSLLIKQDNFAIFLLFLSFLTLSLPYFF